MVNIILIGRCCRISFDIIDINLKKESSLFEWVWTDTLDEINFIINKIIKKEQILIIRNNGNDYLQGTNIKTSHYINKDYNEIVIRRSQRFINDLLNKKEILFIRDDVLGTIKYEEIEQFFDLIKKINPKLSFKMLLLSEKEKYKEIIYPNLHHKTYNKSLYLLHL